MIIRKMTVFDFNSLTHIGHNSFIFDRKGMANAQWAHRLLSTHGFLAKTRIQQMSQRSNGEGGTGSASGLYFIGLLSIFSFADPD